MILVLQQIESAPQHIACQQVKDTHARACTCSLLKLCKHRNSSTRRVPANQEIYCKINIGCAHQLPIQRRPESQILINLRRPVDRVQMSAIKLSERSWLPTPKANPATHKLGTILCVGESLHLQNQFGFLNLGCKGGARVHLRYRLQHSPPVFTGHRFEPVPRHPRRAWRPSWIG